jgi:hypothetical protein
MVVGDKVMEFIEDSEEDENLFAGEMDDDEGPTSYNKFKT